MPPSSYIARYGMDWPTPQYDDLKIEMEIIRRGGQWTASGIAFGHGLPFHYEAMRRILWPNLDGDHNGQRWHTLCNQELRRKNAKVTVIMGCGSSGKTHEPSWNYLCEYFIFPEETCVLVSSTDIRGLKKRVWGEMVMLWEQAVAKYDYLSGHLLDSAVAITTDDIEDCDPGERRSRDMRKGVFGVPCIQGGKFVGLQKFVGIKQKRMRLVADEAQFMGESFLSAFANLDKNVDFQAAVLGNPNDILDSLGKAAEPADGWQSHLEPVKTEVWNTRFMHGRCLNLVGLDTPNNDFPSENGDRFPYLISRRKIENTLSFFAKDSIEYYSQCVGTMKIGMMARRVLTRDMCKQFKAQEDVVWSGTARTKIYFVDAGYGGDRCIGGSAEFGEDVTGKIILAYDEPKNIPILVGTGVEPEYQIAAFMKEDCVSQGIPPENVGHDATGRGSLGTAIAQVWSNKTNPVESGGIPTDRPVHSDMFIIDPRTQQRRLKTCREHYDRRVSEFWFSVRYAVESAQVRGLAEEAMDELCTRKWDLVSGEKRSVEIKNGTPKNPGMKQRTGKSPDVGDWAAGIVEMARRRGFQIAGLANTLTGGDESSNWLKEREKKYADIIHSKQLAKR